MTQDALQQRIIDLSAECAALFEQLKKQACRQGGSPEVFTELARQHYSKVMELKVLWEECRRENTESTLPGLSSGAQTELSNAH